MVAAFKTRGLALRGLGPACRGAGSDAEAADLIERGVREALAELADLGDLARRVAASGPDDGNDDVEGERDEDNGEAPG